MFQYYFKTFYRYKIICLTVCLFLSLKTVLFSQQNNYHIIPFSYKGFQYGIGLGYEKYIKESSSIVAIPIYRWRNSDTQFEDKQYSGLELSIELRKYSTPFKKETIKNFVGLFSSINYIQFKYSSPAGFGDGWGPEFSFGAILGFNLEVNEKIGLFIYGNGGYKATAHERIPIDSPFGSNAIKRTDSVKGMIAGINISVGYRLSKDKATSEKSTNDYLFYN